MSPPCAAVPCSFLFLMITTSLLIPFPRYAWGFDSRYEACETGFSCGNISNISYPFWLKDGGKDYCGHPDYELECQGNILTLTIMSHEYLVLDIVREKQSMTVVRMDLLWDVCPQENGAFSLDDHFGYTTNDLNATLFFDCQQQPVPGVDPQYEFRCSMKGVHQLGYLNVSGEYYDKVYSQCPARFVVPIRKSAAQDILNNTKNAIEAVREGFEVTWTLDMELCRGCLGTNGSCGYNKSFNEFCCFCFDGTHPSTCTPTPPVPGSSEYGAPPPETPPKKTGRELRLKFITAGGSLIASVLLFSMGIICYCFCKRRPLPLPLILKGQSKSQLDIETFIKHHGSLAPKRFSYSEVKKMSSSFKIKLGEGGFGAVYKGKFLDGTSVAIKLLNSSKGNGEEFINEVASISRTSHVNVVTLLGFCFEGCKKALIYEYMSNGSLDKFIYNDQNAATTGSKLGIERLYNIAIGIARGLEYLHRGCNTRILHFDIKPHNILLDEDFCPKISDFGLSKLCLKKESIVSMLAARGTIGYIAPEVYSRNFGGVSHKSDVYSYGMMLIDMVGGKNKFIVEGNQSSEVYFPDQIYRLLERGRDLGHNGSIRAEENNIARKMLLVGLWCIQTVPSQRPTMSKAIDLLEGSIEALEIPPKPTFISPARSPEESFSSSVLLDEN